MIVPVILCGGSGTRLWPLSRELYPKQLLNLVGEGTMLQQTVGRLDGLENLADPLVICNESHRFLVAEQLRQADIHPDAIILEPMGRNTAPAVAAAAMYHMVCGSSDEMDTAAPSDDLLLVLPADHRIRDNEAFLAAVRTGAKLADQGRLVTFGIVPDAPETGYGYIRRGAEISAGASEVAEFVEKPTLELAATFLARGDYFWNSGMFLFRASAFLRELEAHAPDILAACRESVKDMRSDLDFQRLGPDAFDSCRSESIDYAVMEKTAVAAVVPMSAGWSDLGDWSALFNSEPGDEDGNVIRGDVHLQNSHNCYLHATDRMIAAVGLEDHIVVETADAVLVASKDRAQDVKHLVEKLRDRDRGEAALHREVFRPWGSFDSIGSGDRYQVKRLTVKPGATLSLQKHHHRAEHWIVVSGTAEITRDDEVFLLTENQSTYIPLGAVHRIANPGSLPLEIVEVQSGSYLGEDDIVRFEDTYGRAGRTD